jgi:ureidoacrylate peracid hydrolase
MRKGYATCGFMRFCSFLGSSNLEAYLRVVELTRCTLLIGGMATNVCANVTARDAMMLNFKVIMVPDALATWTMRSTMQRLPTSI